jgi:hypothetical protein
MRLLLSAMTAVVLGGGLVVQSAPSAPDPVSQSFKTDVRQPPAQPRPPGAPGTPGAPAPRAPSAPGVPAPGAPGAPNAPGAPGAPGAPRKGTSTLRGYVTAADTGNPLRRALVRAFSQDGGGSGFATSDANGRFEITELPGGRYTINVSKAGYVAMAYGQRRPEQQGTILEIPEGATVEKLGFSLPRGGVITGNVLDEFGDPVAGAQVSALRFRYSAGGRRLLPAGMGQTDDRGAFRIFGLTPGDYYVSAALRTPQQQMMMPGSAGAGPVEGYAPTYYPGTPNPAEASRVTVRAAQEASNISMALISARLARLSGRVVNSRGGPVVQGMVWAMPSDRMTMMMGNTVMTGIDGSFQMAGVPPGTYNLTIRPRGAPSPDAEFATLRVTVGASDLDGLIVVTAPGAIARGVITTDDGTPPNLVPEQVTIVAREPNPEPMPGGVGDAVVHPDWTFQLTGLSGARLISAFIAQNPSWAVKAVFHGTTDVTDSPVEFVPGDLVEGFNIVLTRKLTELSGRITGERDAIDTDATVIAFSENPERWNFGTRFIRSARPDQDGRYTLRGLPPHDYLVVAVKEMEPGQTQDPEFLESLKAQAVRVSLSEGESRTVDLKSRR